MNIVKRMKSLITLLCLMASPSSFAAFVITSAQFDQATQELFFTYTDGVEQYDTTNIRPANTSYFNVCVTKNNVGWNAYATDTYCAFSYYTSTYAKNYYYWADFQKELMKRTRLGTSGSWKGKASSVNANIGNTRTCVVYEGADGRNARLTTSCVNTVLKPFTTGCDITGPTVLDHGLVDSTDFNGNTASLTAKITCPTPAKVVITVPALSDNTVNFYNGIQSTITINGSKFPPPITINGSADVQIASTLTPTGGTVKAGAFSGSAVVVVDVL
ncbi:PapG chaperone-binding domain-containing protein [Serratia sp. N21D137]|uniref:MrpH family fimbial adhesin n=1 Tax=Serratia sp. N21D137 TaxID=3397495 RepID=UPI0039E0933B